MSVLARALRRAAVGAVLAWTATVVVIGFTQPYLITTLF